MHMADALLSPAVGGTMWAATAAATVYSSRKVRKGMDDYKVPLMGVLGAFIFAAQMINFTIPATGSSGHLGGGMILAILLGPQAAFLTMASVLTVQALFFADGGLLALGANIFNLGVFSCFVAYPFIYRPIAGKNPGSSRIMTASIIASVAALQFGSLGVVLETVSSGISELPLKSFLLLMQPLHLAIGVVEGVVTAAVVSFVWRAQPEILQQAGARQPSAGLPVRYVMAGLLAAALATGGVLSWFASQNPDGLEWSISRLTGSDGLKETEGGIHEAAKRLQDRTALLPNYEFKSIDQEVPEKIAVSGKDGGAAKADTPSAPIGTGVSGVVGGFITLLVAFTVGWVLRRRGRTA